MILDAQSELHLKNKAYRTALELYVWGSFKQDLPKKDLTTRAFLGRASKKIVARITANEEGVLAGMQEVKWFLDKLGLKIIDTKKDGTKLKKGVQVLKIKGSAYKILAAERTLLNLIQRMSGIATKTKKMTLKLSPKIKLLATRKTLWGLLDKRAVAVGGGGTHRLHLSDAILIKENHISITNNFKKSLKSSLKKLPKVRFVEIELESEIQVNEFLEALRTLKKFQMPHKNLIVMLDNFTPQKIHKILPRFKEAGVLVELSGGINERNISRYNIAGVAAISSSAMTMAAPHLDLSLDILKES